MQNITLVFNKLTFIKEAGSKNGNKLWLCTCSCGKETVARATRIRSGKTKSCGCFISESNKVNYYSLYRRAKSAAKSRNISFSLTVDQFIKLISANCYYCNKEPEKTLYRRDKNKTPIAKYMGIDRLDNDKGYLADNCVTCCSRCNTAKLDSNLEDFLEMIRKIYNFRIKKKEEGNENDNIKK